MSVKFTALVVLVVGLFCLPSRAVTSCIGTANSTTAQQALTCNLSVIAGDKVIMGVTGPSASFCEKDTASGSVSTLTCQIAVATGDKVIMVSSAANQTPTFSSTTPSETFTQQRSQQRQATGKYIVLADATVAGSSGTMTCSVNQGVNLTFWMMGCIDVGPLGAIDVQNSATGGSSAATTSVTTTQSGDYLISLNQQQGGSNYTMGGSFVDERQDFSNSGAIFADQIAGAAGTYTATSTVSSSSWATMLIAYKTTSTPAQHLPTFSSTSPSVTWTTRMSQNGSGNSGSSTFTYQVSIADAVSSSTGTMTCSADLGAPGISWSVFCLDNGPLGAVDSSNGATGRSGTATTSVTASQANDYYVSLSTLSGGVYSINTGYTTEQSDSSFSGGLIADQTFASSGAHSATASITSTGWTIGLIAYISSPPLIKHKSILY